MGAEGWDWRVWTAVGALLVALIAIQFAAHSAAGRSIVMHSGLLDRDLPGTLPRLATAEYSAQLQQVANGQAESCGMVEIYRITDKAALNAALEEAQAEQHYFRYRSKQNPGLSRWEGPNRLLMLESEGQLLICELEWPMSG